MHFIQALPWVVYACVCVLDTGEIAEGDPIFYSLFEQKLLRFQD